MSVNDKCPECGGLMISGEACPACLLGVGLESISQAGAGGSTGSWTPPSIEELAGRFPELELLELLGRGGMGAVYKARQKALNRLVAVKILPPEIGKKPAFADRFSREAHSLARLNHPCIVTIYDFGERDGLYFFIMEFVDGVNLRQLLDSARVSPREALAIVPQICDALQCAHDQGIVHRDIKPENILMDRQGRIKIADFGLAKLISSDGGLMDGTAVAGNADFSDGIYTLAAVGTPSYMAPEQVEHPGDVDHRADIYALGVVFYQMLTGELPGKKLEPPSQHSVQIDVRLDEVVLRALEKNPQLRFQQASAMKTKLETIAGDAPGKIPATVKPTEIIPRKINHQKIKPAISNPKRGSKGWLITAIALHAIIFIATAIYFMFVVPRFCAMYADMGHALPGVTCFMINIGNFVQRGGWLLMVPVLLLDVVICLLTFLSGWRKSFFSWVALVTVLSCGWFACVIMAVMLPLHSMKTNISAVSDHAWQNEQYKSLAKAPHKLRTLPKGMVISAALANIQLPWAWQELEKRLDDGLLSKIDATTLMDGLIRWLEEEHPHGYNSSLYSIGNSLEKLDKNKLLDDEQVIRFLVALHGAPELNPLPRLRESNLKFSIDGSWRNIWEKGLLGFVLLNDLRSVTIDGESIELSGSLVPTSTQNSIDGSSFRKFLTLQALKPGRHQVKCEIVSALIPVGDMVGLGMKSLSDDWPSAKKCWVRSCEAELQVYGDEEQIVTLVDDPAFDPKLSGSLSVKKVAIHSVKRGQSTKVTVVFDVKETFPLALAFDVKIRLGGVTHSNEYFNHCNKIKDGKNVGSSGNSSFSYMIPALDQDIEVAEITLTPNAKLVEQNAAVDRIWGKQVVFKDQPLTRYDSGDRVMAVETDDVVSSAAAEADNERLVRWQREEAERLKQYTRDAVVKRWIMLVVGVVLSIAVIPLLFAALIWIVVGARKGAGLERCALVLSLTGVIMGGLMLVQMQQPVGGSYGSSFLPILVLCVLVAMELGAFIMGFIARKTKEGKIAMVISGVISGMILMVSLIVLVIS